MSGWDKETSRNRSNEKFCCRNFCKGVILVALTGIEPVFKP